MKRSARLRTAGIGCLVAVGVLLPIHDPAHAAPRLKVLERGFKVATYSSCVAKSDPLGVLPIMDAECSPGGPWGNFIYLAVQDVAGAGRGGVVRLDLTGRTTPFAYFAGASPVDLAFSPAQGAFGDHLWAVTDGSVHGPAALDSDGQLAGNVYFEEPFGIAFDPTGAFSGALLAYTPVGFFPNGPFGEGVYSLADPQGPAVQLAPSLAAIPRRFGPGGLWGTDLYASTGWILAPDGTATRFPFPFDEFDWMSGPAWGGDMFARCGSDAICRVKPDGTATVFATGASGQNLQIVSCGGSLWVLETSSCRRIAPGQAPLDP